MRSIIGASQSPARKPRTTLGSAAMISTTGLSQLLSVGCMNSLTNKAASNARGTAKSSA